VSAEATHRADDRLVTPAGQRITGEGDAGQGRLDEALNDDGHGGWLTQSAASLRPVGGHADIERRSPAVEDGPLDRVDAAHIQHRGVLAGERGVQTILVQGGGAHRQWVIAKPPG
jgi:hypothetical protein